MKLNPETLDTFWVAMVIILVSSLPYLSDFITNGDGIVRDWVPVIGIQALLTDSNGLVLGHSSYNIFLYLFFFTCFATIGWWVWWFVAKDKPYRILLWAPIFINIYQLTLMLLHLRRSMVSEWYIKFFILLGLMLPLVAYTLKRNPFTLKLLLQWTLLFICATLPFLHNIITERNGELKTWVPIFGIEELLTQKIGEVMGFRSYRIFLFAFFKNLFAHLGWLGAFIYYNHNIKKPRFFLLVPVALTLYAVVSVVFDKGEEHKYMYHPDLVFFVLMTLGVLLAVNFYFNNKVENRKTLTDQDTL